MTNTKFRKRALLSSVAMLLVALVALGSATFAWFAADTTVRANGMVFKTSTSSGLVARTVSELAVNTDATWRHDVTLNADAVDASATSGYSTAASVALQPATATGSATDGVPTLMTTTASDAYHYNKNASASWSGNGANISDKIWFRTTENGDGSSIYLDTITVTINENTANTNMSGVSRVVVSHGSDVLGIWKATGANNPGRYYDGTTYHDGTTGQDPDQGYYEFKADGGTYTFASGSGIEVTASNTNTNAYLVVTVYIDGEDENCKSENVVSSDILNGINVAVTSRDTQ